MIKLATPLLILLLSISACESTERTQGHVINDRVISEIIPGETSSYGVASKLGTPTTTSDFGGKQWYYISTKLKDRAFLKPEIIDHRVIAVSFDEGGVVESINEYTKDNMAELRYSSDKTPTEGQQLSIIQQLLGNVGKFNREAVE